MTYMSPTRSASSTLHFAEVAFGRRKPRRTAQQVGYMAIHAEKGVYLGASRDGAPVYAVRRDITTTKRDQLIPLLLDDVSLLALNGISIDDKRAIHLFQVAAIEGIERQGFKYTDVRRAFHFSSGDVKTAIYERADEAVHLEAPLFFKSPRHFEIACKVIVAANRVLPFGRQPEYVPLG